MLKLLVSAEFLFVCMPAYYTISWMTGAKEQSRDSDRKKIYWIQCNIYKYYDA